MPHLLIALALLCAPLAIARAGEGYFESQVGVLVEYYEIDERAASPLMREYQNAPDASSTLKKVQELHAAGKARLVDSSYVVGRANGGTELSSVRELIYPTDYDPANLPRDLTGPIDPQATIVIPATPVDFATRALGASLEFAVPEPDPRGSYQLKLEADLSVLLGFKNWGQGVNEATSPVIARRRTDRTVELRAAGCELLGNFRNESGKHLLGFVSLFEMLAASEKEFQEYQAHPPSEKQIKARQPDPDANPFDEAVGEPEPPKQISLITEYIEVDAALAAQLIRQLDTISDATAIRTHLDTEIAEGKATLLDLSHAVTASGLAVASNTVREHIFPTIFDLPGELGESKVRPTPRTPGKLAGPIIGKVNVTTPLQPSAFKVHETGLEFEVFLGSSHLGLIELQLSARRTELAGVSTYGEGANATQRPLLESLHLSSNIAIPDGTTALVAMHGLETARAGKNATEAEQNAARGRRILVFLTAKIKTL